MPLEGVVEVVQQIKGADHLKNTSSVVEKPVSNHLLGADGLRAFACLLVVFHHVGLTLDFKAGVAENWLGIFVPIGGYGVVIFFVLSGFLLSRPFWSALRAGEKLPSLRTYFLRRFARIVPGFWLSMVLSLILGLVLGVSAYDTTTFLRFASGMLFLNEFASFSIFPVETNGPLWSISYEIGSYLIMPAAFALLFILRHRVRHFSGQIGLWSAVILAAFGLHMVFVSSVGMIPVPDFSVVPFDLMNLGKIWFPRFNIFSMFAIFAFGVLASAAQLQLAAWRSYGADILAALSLIAIGVFLFAVERPFFGGASIGGIFRFPYNGYPLLPALLAVFLATAPSSVIIGRMTDGRVLRYLAKISFGIYIYHVLVLTLLQVAFFGKSIPATSHMQAYAELLGTLGITFCVAHLSWYRLEKRIIDWARSFEIKRPKVSAGPEAF